MTALNIIFVGSDEALKSIDSDLIGGALIISKLIDTKDFWDNADNIDRNEVAFVISARLYEAAKRTDKGLYMDDFLELVNLAGQHVMTFILDDAGNHQELDKAIYIKHMSDESFADKVMKYTWLDPKDFDRQFIEYGLHYVIAPGANPLIVERMRRSDLFDEYFDDDKNGDNMDDDRLTINDIELINGHAGMNSKIEDFVLDRNANIAIRREVQQDMDLGDLDDDLMDLLKQFADPLPVRRPLETSKTTKTLWKKTVNQVIYDILNQSVPFVILQGPRLSGKSEIINMMAWRCLTGDHVPNLLNDRRVFKIKDSVLAPSSTASVCLKEFMSKLMLREVPDLPSVILYTDNDHVFDKFSTITKMRIPLIGERVAVAKPGDKDPIVNSVEIICPLSVNENLEIVAKYVEKNKAYYLNQYGYVPSRKVIRKIIQMLAYDTSVNEYEPLNAVKELNEALSKWSCDSDRSNDDTEITLQYVEKRATDILAITPQELNSVSRFIMRSEKNMLDKGNGDRAAMQATEEYERPKPEKKASEKNALGGVAFKTSNELLEALKEKVVGQDAALEKVIPAIARRCAGISGHERPVASFLFTGPSGVGKTETAKAIAEVVYGSKDALLRIDCSELYAPWMISRLLGASRGYVDSDEGGQLTRFVKEHPNSVILFDEIEKAHPSINDAILLQLLDYGHITSPTDGTVDCTNCTIIMTSNLGAGNVSKDGVKELGFGNMMESADDVKDKLRKLTDNEVAKRFRVELINRIDDVVMFDMLSMDSLEKIFDLKWSPIAVRLAAKGVKVELGDGVIRWFAEKSKMDKYGARNLVRTIDHEFVDKITDTVLSGFKGVLVVSVKTNKDGEKTLSIRKKTSNGKGEPVIIPTPLEVVHGKDGDPIEIKTPDGPIDDSDKALKKLAKDLHKELERRKSKSKG